MVYNSLTDAPHNLKEGIDWLIALKGTNAESNFKAMAAAVHKFLADKPVGKMDVPALNKIKSIFKKFIGQSALNKHSFVRRLLGRFERKMSTKVSLFHKRFGSLDPSDCENVIEATGVKPEHIAVELAKAVDGCEKFLGNIKASDHYESAYSSRATWDSSCSRNPEACAVVLVGIAPILYTGLRSLKEASANVANRQWLVSYTEMHLKNVMKAVGYKTDECRSGISGLDIFKTLRNVKYDILNSIYSLAGFWAFYGFDKMGDLVVEITKDRKAVPAVDGKGKQPVIPEAEPSVDPVKPEVGEVEQPVKVAKAAKVAKSGRSGKKTTKVSQNK
ncbi:hypothetical protein BBBOND_0201910 [Babesia bigemina]|uniref:Uncharacterized protein n=1 Tax=Babesia bigemina TaxID=5866 RepID=A0A061D7Y5_BABBI|nr:hypothetical protein BBBOND_0201910 [Babesia bigemina]CDR95034.1 hypothetical protein BBBOND_0201910 [Babesia bigemina]|eukprot:XP_012767220.1 hypothetical protein BBBOND_0201910 [Babesia bigemina]